MVFQKCYFNHSIFIRKTSFDTVILIVNVDNILLNKSDVASIKKAKEYLNTQFVIKDMGRPRYLVLKSLIVNLE